MRKLMLILSLALLPATSWAACELAKDMGKRFVRCENSEAVCYGLAPCELAKDMRGCKNSEDEGLFLSEVPISCFRK